MSSKLLSRREFSARLAASVPLAVAGGFTLEKISRQAGSMDSGGLSHSAGAIHQEVVFKASRKRVYEALTDAAQFTSVTKFSMVKDAPPAEISREPGGAFACFGGYISGRHVELKRQVIRIGIGGRYGPGHRGANRLWGGHRGRHGDNCHRGVERRRSQCGQQACEIKKANSFQIITPFPKRAARCGAGVWT